jgi:hypothetical protein
MTLYICDHADRCSSQWCLHGRTHGKVLHCPTHEKIPFCPYHDSQCNPVKKEPMFKIGDKVRILGKTIGLSLFATCYNIGDTDEVYGIGKDYIRLRIVNSWKFRPSDLELIKEPTMDKYKLLKPITLKAMEEAGTSKSCVDFQNFAIKVIKKGYGINGEISLKDALEWRNTKFLFEKGFIGEEDVFYKIGDRFQLKNPDRIFGLAPVSSDPDKAQLINSDFTTHYGKPIEVRDLYSIPHHLIAERFGGKEFTKI